MQSVNPPVEAPISMQTFSFSVIGNCCIAFSSLSPPRLTYFRLLPFTSICSILLSSKVVPGLSSLCPFTNTFPAISTALAFSRDSASPRFTSITSNRSFIFSP